MLCHQKLLLSVPDFDGLGHISHVLRQRYFYFSAWFFGDPHIHTLDNVDYTFNGLGEYTLIETSGGNFTLQGRTAKAIDDKGTETKATVFSAFAAKDIDSDRVYIAMNEQSNGTQSFEEREINY